MSSRKFRSNRNNRSMRSTDSNVRKSSYVFEYRITFLGAEKVGKSAIINQFIEKEFIQHHTPTAEDHLTHVVEHRGNMCVCLLVDTAGSDDFPAMRKLSVTKGNAFIVVYSIDDRKSFERAKKFVEEIKENKQNSSEVKIVVVGNKVDLESKRQVSYSEGISYTASLHEGNVITAFAESSATDYESVTEIVQKLLNMFIPPPPSIEVPVLNERKLSLPKLFTSRSSLRRSSKGLIERKISEGKPMKSESFSDSEVGLMNSPASPTSNQMIAKAFRKRADSSPVVKVPSSFILENIQSHSRMTSQRRSLSPPESLSATKNEKSSKRNLSPLPSCIQEIGDPVLISHSVSLNRYTLTKPRSASVNSNSSNDSGVSDDCNSPEFPPKFNLGRRASLPVHSTNPFGNGQRRASFSVKMRGIFKKSKSPCFDA